MKILLTGSNGFIGKHLISHLSQTNSDIFTIGRRPVQSNVKHIQLNNINDTQLIEDSINELKPDFIIHLAGTTFQEDALESLKVNSQYAIHILNALEKSSLLKKTKVILMGSAAEYGYVTEESFPLNEDHSAAPYNLYGITKFAQTKIALDFKDAQVMVLRPFTVLGKGMPSHLAIGSFVKQISENENNLLETGNLNTTRDFIDVEDAVQLIWKLMQTDEAYGKIVNLCSGKETKILDMVNFLIEKSGKNIQLKTKEERVRKLDMPRHYGDNARLLKLIGPFEFTPWKKTLANVMEGYE